MALPGIPIPETQCIGDSLFSINNALTALDSSVIELINAGGITDVTGTAPITVTGTDVKNVSLGAVVPSNLGGAGTVNGLLKANGAGTVSAAVAGTDYLTTSTLSSSPATVKAWAVFDPFVGYDPANIYNYSGSAAGAIRSYNINSVSRAAWIGTGWPGVHPSPTPSYTLTFPSGVFTNTDYTVYYTFSKGSGLQAENLSLVSNKTLTSVTLTMTNVYNAQTNTGDNLANYRINIFLLGN